MALKRIWTVRFIRGVIPHKIHVLSDDVHGALAEAERLIRGIYVITDVERTEQEVSV